MDNGELEKTLRISAVIPAYNAEKYIARSIDSVLNQTCPVDEIIVVDDGSADNTGEVVKRYGDKVRYIYQENAGASAARNAGIEAACGDWIAFLDGDDEWLPDKIRLQTDLLKRNPDLVWTTGNYIECLCDEGRRAEQTTRRQCVAYLEEKDFFDSYFRAIQLYQWGCTDCKLIRKDVLIDVGLFCTDLPKANDIDVWLRIAYQYPAVGFSCEPLAVYHLSVADSIVKKYRAKAIYADFIQRHLTLAEQQGALEQLKPAAAFMMRRWIRGMLFGGRKAEIRELLNRFPHLFSAAYRALIYTLTIFPNLTAAGLRMISKIVRALKLRRRVTRRPPKFAS